MTMLQSRGKPVHVPISPLGEDRCVGEGTRIIRNSLEVSGRFRGFPEGSREVLPESSGRNGYQVYREERYSTCLIDRPVLYSGFRSVTSS